MFIMDVWSNMTRNFPKYATDAYGAIDPWFYPLLFFGIIGYVYAYSKSVVVASVAILITLGLFGVTAFVGVGLVGNFLYIVVAIGLGSLIITFVKANYRRF